MSHQNNPADPAGEPPIGELALLHAGLGDTNFKFNSESPHEVETAQKVIRELLDKKFVILVRVPGSDQYRRVTDFDATVNEYIIQDQDPAKKRIKAAESAATVVPPTSGG